MSSTRTWSEHASEDCVPGGTAINLRVLLDGSNDGDLEDLQGRVPTDDLKPTAITWRTSCTYDPDGRRVGSWRFPERT